MGGLISAPKDIWITIYERGITDAQKVQKQALKLVRRHAHRRDDQHQQHGTTIGVVDLFTAHSLLRSPPSPSLCLQTVEGKLSAVAPNFIDHRGSPGGSQLSDGNKSHSSTGSFFHGGGFSNAGGGNSGHWTNNSGAYIAPTATEKFSVISTFVESEWSERDRREMKSHAAKLWKQYHKAKDAPGMKAEELQELTKDSLTVLQSHISLFINNSYEEMKKHTQTCMINLLQRYRQKDVIGGASGPGAGSQSGGGSGTGASISGNTNNSSSVSATTINVNDIDWLNEQVEAEKRNMMQLLNTQIEEWIDHSADVAEALQNMMVRPRLVERERESTAFSAGKIF